MEGEDTYMVYIYLYTQVYVGDGGGYTQSIVTLIRRSGCGGWGGHTHGIVTFVFGDHFHPRCRVYLHQGVGNKYCMHSIEDTLQHTQQNESTNCGFKISKKGKNQTLKVSAYICQTENTNQNIKEEQGQKTFSTNQALSGIYHTSNATETNLY